MSTELPKTYDPASIEAGIYQAWQDEKCFHPNPADAGDGYSIVIPPPNVTGALHLGHAINNTLQDILTRKARMEGKNALWIPGLDHAGIATQAVVEKQLKENENKTRHDIGREALVQRIWDWKQQYGDRIISQLKRLGCSCDWDRQHFTLDDQCARAVRETFFKLFKDGLVYRGKRLVNWDTHLQTSISDDEIYHENVKTNLWHIRYEIVDSPSNAESTSTVPSLPSGESRSVGERKKAPSSARSHPNLLPAGEGTGAVLPQVDRKEMPEDGTFLESFSSDPESQINLPNDNEPDAPRPTHMTVATTRPETLLGDTAVAVHSTDSRWNWAIGKSVKLPLLGRLIPIIADDVLVDPKFGSGVVKVTPAHDPNDYAVWQRHQNQTDAIDIINLLNTDGTLNDAAGPYKGLPVNKARTKVVADLEAAGLLAKIEPYETQVGHSDRSKTPIQPYLSDQWFVKMAPLAEPALEVVRDGTIQFFPERHAQQYLSWLGEKRDWPISRQLWWGHRIPIWQKRISITPENFYDEIVMRNLEHLFAPIDRIDREQQTTMVGQFVRVDTGERIQTYKEVALSTCEYDVTVCTTSDQKAKSLEAAGFVQDPDVLDTWFSSALWPFSTLGWPDATADLAKWYPTSVLLTGRDIITLWVARMVMMGMYNLGLRTKDLGLSGEGLAESINFGGEQYHDPIQSPKRDEAAMAGHDPNFQQVKDQFSEAEAHPPRVGESIARQVTSSTRKPPQSTETAPSLPPGESRSEGERAAASSAKTESTGARPHPNLLPEGEGTGKANLRRLGVPFAHVAINPTILDGKGERMSKSKGNGVDPVEIIDTHGADALRFTLATMATETQDVRLPVQLLCPHCGNRFDNPAFKNDSTLLCPKCKQPMTRPMGYKPTSDAPVARVTSEKFDFGRNFCNKLWNATRFVFSNIPAGSTPPPYPADDALSLADRWIVTRFARTLADANAAIASYRFDLYAKACYDFFWGDYCDWYLEIIKPTLKTPAGQASLAVAIDVLDGVLRLMHPVIPFITETIWEKLNEFDPARLKCTRTSKRLCQSDWARTPPIDEASEHIFPRLQAIVGAIRNVRNEHKADLRKVVNVSIAAPGEAAVKAVNDNRGLIETLATCSITAVAATLAAPAEAVRVTVNGDCDVYIEGLIDPEAEKQRVIKRREELTKQRAAISGRLSNEAYIAKAPPKLVEDSRQQLAAIEAELAKLG